MNLSWSVFGSAVARATSFKVAATFRVNITILVSPNAHISARHVKFILENKLFET